MTQEELNKIVENHQHWIKRDCDGWEYMRADLSGIHFYNADFYGANLYRANLGGADLKRAHLYGADLGLAYLYGADLSRANLSGADFYKADLSRADLSRANLCGADLSEANLSGADLCGAYLYGANLYGANLSEAKNVPYIPMVCPEEGSFIGWKNVAGYIIKLEVPAKAKRSSATNRKCRCEYAKVLGIYTFNGKKAEVSEVTNTSYMPHITYKIGEMVYPDSFDEDRWNECSHGIHFFINRQEAINF